MLQKTFGIYSEDNDACRLYVEIGSAHVACWCTSETGSLRTFEFFTFNPNEFDFAETFRQVKLNSTLLNKTYEQTNVIWENEDCVCIPDKYFNTKATEKLISEVTGETASTTSMYYEVENTIVAYRVKNDHLKIISNELPSAQQVHKYGLMVRSLNKEEKTNDYLKIIFYNHYFLLMAVHDQQLQLIQRFEYKTAEDVVYHILNVATKLNISSEESEVIVSGLIDLHSALYKELYKYIQHLKVDSVQDNSGDVQHEYPSHYLIPFYKYAV